MTIHLIAVSDKVTEKTETVKEIDLDIHCIKLLESFGYVARPVWLQIPKNLLQGSNPYF